MLKNLQLNSQNKILLISFIIFILLYFVLSLKNKEAKKNLPAEEKNKPLYADTLIPKGQVLIPIELANVEAVAGLIDQYGLVDLYANGGNHAELIVTRVKIMRAPLNKNQYAVMVNESRSLEIMKHKGPFFVVVQSRFVKTEERPRATALNKKKYSQMDPLEIEYFQGEEE